jgi:predicted dehydrogenase
MAISYRFNAGALPPSSWIQDPTQGGRIIGEACHALDVMVFLTGSLPVEVVAYALPPIAPGVLHDTVTALIRFADGSIGTLQYWSNGDRAIEKEWCEVSCQERSAILENFHHIRLARDGKVRRYRFGAGKGHREELEATVAAVTTGSPMPIPYEQLRAVTLATFAIVESLRTGGRPVLLESLDPRTQSANR